MLGLIRFDYVHNNLRPIDILSTYGHYDDK